MNRAGVAFIFASLLAACGGGGGAGTPAPAPPAASAALSPLTMTYAQTATASGNSPLVFPGFTCLNPQTVRTESAAGTVSQTVASNQSFNGETGVTAVTSTIALQTCSDNSEAVAETDYYKQIPFAADASSAVVLLGSVLHYDDYYGAPRDVQITYGGLGLIVVEFPLKSGRTWTNIATRNVSSSAANFSDTLNVNTDGSYTDAVVQLNGMFPYDATTTVEQSDASGTRTEVAGANASAPPYSISLSAPSNNTVVVTTSGTPPEPPDYPTPTSCPVVATPCPIVSPTPSAQYAWYPYDPSASQPLEKIVSVDKGVAALPQSCSVATTFPRSAELIETVDTTLDIWSGQTSATTDAYVDPNDGVLCTVVSTRADAYVLGPTSADTMPVASTTLTASSSLLRESAAPPIFILPAPARFDPHSR